jgi:hypothetical protein
MKAFTGWRNVGYAMRWARTQACVTYDVTRMPGTIEYRWRNGDHGYVCVVHWDDSEVRAGNDWTGVTLRDADAATALDVLAALQLIPRKFSSAYQQGRAEGAGEALLEMAEAVSAGRQQSGVPW